MKRLHVYLIDNGESHWYVASSTRAALRDYVTDGWGKQITIREFRRDNPNVEVTQLPDRRKVKVAFENEGGDYDPVEQTCARWTREQGVGFLATSYI